jgi:cytoskeleton protein RodZ
VFEIGNSLREARLRQRLEFPELERATKIRGKYLRALEEEQFDLLPAQTYVKGFLRTYAEHLGLDGQLYVDEYNSRYARGEEEPPSRVRRPSQRLGRRRVEANVVIVALSAIGLVTALVVAANFGGPDERDSAIPNLVPPPAASKRRKPATSERKPRRQAPRRARLLVTAVEADSWLEVRAGSATGRELFKGTLFQGRTQGFEARQLWINVGRAHRLRWKLNGKAIPVPGSDPHFLIVTPKRILAAPPVT